MKRLILFLLLLSFTVLPAAGADLLQITAQYPGMSGPMRSMEFPYSDDFFRGDPNVYNHKLAQSSLGLEVASFQTYGIAPLKQDEHIIHFLDAAGFDEIEVNGYGAPSSTHSISSAIAQKQIDDFTLIAVAPSGAGYGKAWAGNLVVGSGERHEGFDIAAKKLEEQVEDYISYHQVSGKIRLWIVGFSRASAMSNLAAADFIESGKYDAVFAYLFAVPKTTRAPKAYPNIHNIIGKVDPVPMIPFADWDYDVNGVSHYIISQEYDSKWYDQTLEVNELYLRTTGKAGRNNPTLNQQIRDIFSCIARIFPTPEDYAAKGQPELVSAFESTDFSSSNLAQMIDSAMTGIENLNSDQQQAVSDLSEYLTGILTDYAHGNKLAQSDGSWDPTEPLNANLALEHSIDNYVCWMLSFDDPDEIFSDTSTYVRTVFNGAFDLDVYADAEYLGTLKNATGEDIGLIELAAPEDSPEFSDIFPVSYRNGDSVTMETPTDRDYQFFLTGTEDEDIWWISTIVSREVVLPSNSMVYRMPMEKGHVFNIAADSKGEEIDLDVADMDDFVYRLESSEVVSIVQKLNDANHFKLSLNTLFKIARVSAVFLGILIVCSFGLAVHRLIIKKPMPAAIGFAVEVLTLFIAAILLAALRYFLPKLVWPCILLGAGMLYSLIRIITRLKREE